MQHVTCRDMKLNKVFKLKSLFFSWWQNVNTSLIVDVILQIKKSKSLKAFTVILDNGYIMLYIKIFMFVKYMYTRVGPKGKGSCHLLNMQKWFLELVFHAGEYVLAAPFQIHLLCTSMCWQVAPPPISKSLDPPLNILA